MPENDEWTLSLLTNEEYLKMHKDSNGAHQHYRKETNGKGTVIWVANGKKCKYAALFNTKDKKAKIKFNLSDVLMPDEKYNIFDIWAKKDVAGLLLMPPTRHAMLHLNDCCKWKEQIRTRRQYYRH